MNLTVKLYAGLRDRAKTAQITVELPENSTVAELLTAIGRQYPALEAGLPTAIVAVNREFAAEQQVIAPQDELALFPPVSGGQGERPHPTYFALAAGRPDVNAILAHLTQPDVGAVVTFSGFVRGQTERPGLPQATISLEYESYEEMALAKMAQIAEEIWQKWPQIKGIAIVQRIGLLEIGEPTTLVACASGHRDEGGFEAARYGIDRLKEIVPVWKKEIGQDHSVWVEGHYRPGVQDKRS